jgi:hypothetical protein
MIKYKKDRIAYSSWARLYHPNPNMRQYWDDRRRQLELVAAVHGIRQGRPGRSPDAAQHTGGRGHA